MAGGEALGVGSRVRDAKDASGVGSIRYIGAVEGAQGEWIGVEWDDAGRGKTNGTQNGVRYFTTRRKLKREDGDEAEVDEEELETSGSFVRARRLAPRTNLVSAVRERYCDDGNFGTQLDEKKNATATDATKDDDDVEIKLLTEKGWVGTSVELVGMDAIAARLAVLGSLRIVSVEDGSVAALARDGEDGARELRETVGGVRELFIAGNLLCRRSDLRGLREAAPQLEVLNVSRMPLEIDVDVINEGDTDANANAEIGERHPPRDCALPSVRTLIANSTDMSWTDVTQRLAPCLPNIRELHLCSNNIASLETIITTTRTTTTTPNPNPPPEMPIASIGAAPSGLALGQLAVLSLEDNSLDNWTPLFAALRAVPHLTRLNVCGNALPDLDVGVDGKEAEGFGPEACPRLEALLLARNKITAWTSVNALNRMPSLCEIRLTGNPLVDAFSPSIARLEVIARMERLSTLNGSSVRSTERRDAEIRYLQGILGEVDLAMKADSEGSSSSTRVSSSASHTSETAAPPPCDIDALPPTVVEAVGARHPRFKALFAAYGSAIPRNATANADGSAGPSMAEVQIKCVAPSAGERPPTIRRLPVSMTVAKVGMLCERLYGVPAVKQALSLVLASSAADDFPVPLEDGRNDLAYLGVHDGSTIFVNEIDDMNSSAAAAAAAATSLDERIRIGEEEMRVANAGRVQLAPAQHPSGPTLPSLSS